MKWFHRNRTPPTEKVISCLKDLKDFKDLRDLKIAS